MKSLTSHQLQPLFAVVERLSAQQRSLLAELVPTAAAEAIAVGAHWDFALAAKKVDALIGTDVTDPQTYDLRRALIARWVQALPERLDALHLPRQVSALYPEWIERTIDFLHSDATTYDPDYWAKDVRFSLGLSVPASRSVVLDMSSPLGPRQVLQHAMDGRGLNSLTKWIGTGGWGAWLENHTEARNLSDFTAEGWEQVWGAAAAVLKTRPHLAGTMGASWFYDPQLATVSPRLAYLRKMPMANGAFLVHQGPGEVHTERATATSETRRALIEAGEYVPTSYVLAWPRKSLIRWAEAKGMI